MIEVSDITLEEYEDINSRYNMSNIISWNKSKKNKTSKSTKSDLEESQIKTEREFNKLEKEFFSGIFHQCKNNLYF